MHVGLGMRTISVDLTDVLQRSKALSPTVEQRGTYILQQHFYVMHRPGNTHRLGNANYQRRSICTIVYGVGWWLSAVKRQQTRRRKTDQCWGAGRPDVAKRPSWLACSDTRCKSELFSWVLCVHLFTRSRLVHNITYMYIYMFWNYTVLDRAMWDNWTSNVRCVLAIEWECVLRQTVLVQSESLSLSLCACGTVRSYCIDSRELREVI